MMTAPRHMSEGPVLIFGGPYSNLEATRAVLSQADRLDVPRERVICTGDVVAYCANPAETVELVREAGIHVVMGNCEESLATREEDCGCGVAPGSACDRLSTAWFAYADRQLDADARRWMAGLPRRLDLEIAGQVFSVVHGGVTSINRFLFASSPAKDKAQELEIAECDGIIAGHCGLPFSQVIDGRLWHNAGAVGLPANDGTARTWFTLLVPDGHGIRIEHCPFDYDFTKAAGKVRRAGLPEGYAAALETGLWPSCDVLPSREVRERGVPLNAGHIKWTGAGTLSDKERRRRQLSKVNSSGLRTLRAASQQVVCLDEDCDAAHSQPWPVTTRSEPHPWNAAERLLRVSLGQKT